MVVVVVVVVVVVEVVCVCCFLKYVSLRQLPFLCLDRFFVALLCVSIRVVVVVLASATLLYLQMHLRRKKTARRGRVRDRKEEPRHFGCWRRRPFAWRSRGSVPKILWEDERYPHPSFQAFGRQHVLQHASEKVDADYQDNTSRHTVAQPVGRESVLDAAWNRITLFCAQCRFGARKPAHNCTRRPTKRNEAVRSGTEEMSALQRNNLVLSEQITTQKLHGAHSTDWVY